MAIGHALLLENGDALLLENGDALLLEIIASEVGGTTGTSIFLRGVQGHAGKVYAGSGTTVSMPGVRGQAGLIDARGGTTVSVRGVQGRALLVTASSGSSASLLATAGHRGLVTAGTGSTVSLVGAVHRDASGTFELLNVDGVAYFTGTRGASTTIEARTGSSVSLVGTAGHVGRVTALSGTNGSLAGEQNGPGGIPGQFTALTGSTVELRGSAYVLPGVGAPMFGLTGTYVAFVGKKEAALSLEATSGSTAEFAAFKAVSGVIEAFAGSASFIQFGTRARRGSMVLTVTDTATIDIALTEPASIVITLEDLMAFEGARKRINIELWDETTIPRSLTDPSDLDVVVQHVGDPPVQYAITDLAQSGIGRYTLDVDCPDPGEWRVRAFATGLVVAVEESYWRIRASEIVLV